MRIGLGLAALGRPGYINIGRGSDFTERTVEEMRERTLAVLDAAFGRGVRHFDAARSYGCAEEFLSGWIASRRIAEGTSTIASKWGYRYTADWRIDAPVHEVKEHTREHFERQLAETRALLGGHLSLHQIHSATLESGVLEDVSVLGALARLKRDGIAVGLSVSGPRQCETIERALAVRIDGAPLFDAVQATYNVLERSAEPALIAAHDAGRRVIVKEAVANGRLGPRGDQLQAEAERAGASADALAIAFVLERPFVDVVLSGAATVAQLESNLSALDLRGVGSLDHLRESPADYWAKRATLPWN
jgi:aryl-alcohol dehydrogenase-like predicted oxidoreductase